MAEFAMPPSDEPFDFRHQAATYRRFRRDYSPTLYDAIERRTGPGAGRAAFDVGCGPGFVASTLVRRGWRATGLDFSALMLASARAANPALAFVSARAEALPLRAGTGTLVTCGTAFHWMQPQPALAEFARVLAPGGWVALFWRYAVAGQLHMQAVRDALAVVGVALPDAYEQLRVHAPDPFGGSRLTDVVEERFATTLAFTAESFHGYVATIEFLRRLAGDRHAAFLAELDRRLAGRFAAFDEANEEYLFVARVPSTG